MGASGSINAMSSMGLSCSGDRKFQSSWQFEDISPVFTLSQEMILWRGVRSCKKRGSDSLGIKTMCLRVGLSVISSRGWLCVCRGWQHLE
ncbi:UNVERIFIED_CONTAM: hypothetical protein Sradi_0213200 [Sesamum radiatum]|uniref:Uncharacterized protein n=1 Tax=Sesamum radiatum TaxID=300843 RepID=A0AAW2W101_SESRA